MLQRHHAVLTGRAGADLREDALGQPSSFARTSAPSTGVPLRVTTTLTVAADCFFKSNDVVSPALRSSSALP